MLALFLIVASGLAVDLHRFAFHGPSSTRALNARLGQYCARHGEGVGIDRRSDRTLRAARSAAVCPLCENRFFRHEDFPVPGEGARTTAFQQRPGDLPRPVYAPARALAFAPQTRGPPLS